MTAIDSQSVALAEIADRLRRATNAARGYHPRQHGGTYGAASNALKLSLACGLLETNRILFEVARDIAEEIVETMVCSGEGVRHCLDYHGIEILEPVPNEGFDHIVESRPYRFANGRDGFDG